MAEGADIVWKGDTPVSSRFNDVYFSAASGIAETRHVYLEGNNLPARFKDTEDFTIGELGFGTGLNFLAVWQLWAESHTNEQGKSKAGGLEFISCEKYPLKISDMQKTLAQIPEIETYAELFIRKWKNHIADKENMAGWQVVDFGSVKLRLFIGDVMDMFKDTDFKADAWFLDGFSPAKNPAMWQSPVLKAVARQSARGATLATFTAAGHVRRGLEAAGFDVKKAKGFGHKRDMTVARLCAKL